MPTATSICLNCGQINHNSSKYCSNCSQKIAVHRITPAHLIHETVHYITHADKGIFHLIKMMALNPGKVIREYIEGRRKTYFSPLNFFLIIVGLFVFVQVTFKPMQAVSMDTMRAGVSQIADEEVRSRRMAKVDRMEKALNFVATKSNYVNMAVTPLVALVFYLFFLKRKFNYTEHLVAHLYIVGFSFLFYIFIITPYLLLTKGSNAYFYGVMSFLVFEVVYKTLAYYGFMNRHGWKQFLYCLFISLLTVTGWYFLSTGIIRYYINNGF